jgi:hypothetical protein
MAEVVPFSKEMRKQMDSVIDHVNRNILTKRGYNDMPLHSYGFYQKVNESPARAPVRASLSN